MRKEVPEVGWGDFEVLPTRDPAVLAMRYDWRNNSVLFVHNLSDTPREVAFSTGLAGPEGRRAGEPAQREPQPRGGGRPAHTCVLEPYGVSLVPGRRPRLPAQAQRHRDATARLRRPAMDRRAWWQSAVIYQIYPRSFQDDNGDGVGDLRGILRRLPYLCELGVDAVWISPIFPSPMADFGYDISDYVGIDPVFGTLAGFRRASRRRPCERPPDPARPGAEPHLRPAPWFQESRASRQSARRDWYIWRDPAPGRRPAQQLALRLRRQRVGAATRAPASTTTTRSWPRSPISTGAIRRCAPRCTRSCASGCGGASTASGST